MNNCFTPAGVLCLLVSLFALAAPPSVSAAPELGWSSFYNHPSGGNELDPVIGRDAAGNVYLGGTAATGGETNGSDIVVNKYDPNGNLVWTRSFNGTGDFRDSIIDMHVAPDGDIYVAGSAYSLSVTGGSTNYDYVMLKYDTAGVQKWVRTYAGLGQDDFPDSAKLDADENFYVTGHSRGAGGRTNYVTLKFNQDGNQLWDQRYAGGFGEIPGELEIDGQGNVYVSGYSAQSAISGSNDIVTVKYNAAGQQQWVNKYNSPVGNDDRGFELEITPQGDVVVLGEIRDQFSRAMPVVHKINGSSGAAIWSKLYEIVAGQDEFTNALRVDAAGNIIFAGMVSLPDGGATVTSSL